VKDTATFQRATFAAALVLAPVLGLLASVLQPPFAADYVDRLAELDQAGTAAWVSNSAFLVMQMAMLVAFLAIASLVRERSPRLANLGSALAVPAVIGEAVMGGMGMVFLAMAQQPEHRELFAGVWEDLESSPVMLFAVVGVGFTVLTQILLSIGLYRSRVVPRWVPALIWAFLALEFVGSNLSAFASYAGVLCLLIAYLTLAREVWSLAPALRETREPVTA
jgi:hypothetical protein